MDLESLKEPLLKLSKSIKFEREEPMRKLLSDAGIELTSTGGRSLGRCYHASYYEIRSKEQLPDDFIKFLRNDVNMLGYGQEFDYSDPIQVDGLWLVKVESRVDSSD